MDDATTISWLRLSRLEQPRHRVKLALVDALGCPAAVFEASRAELAVVVGAAAGLVQGQLACAGRLDVSADLAWLEHPGRSLLTCLGTGYPPLLAQLPDFPIILFVRGDPAVLTRPQIAIVGSRNPTPLGRDAARRFAAGLGAEGVVVTSGLALGIDGAAHGGALDANGMTAAVAATGLDQVYPRSHRSLAGRIAESGVLVSEFHVGTPPRRVNFPRRNRIISGLSLGVLVVEAALRSGSLITARLAAEQGRDVFAVPGSIHSPTARGCHRLIQQGAKLVESTEDVLCELGWETRTNVQGGGLPATTDLPGVSENSEQALLEWVDFAPTTVDRIVESSGLTADSVCSMLLSLELQGYVERCPGGGYIRTP